MLYHVISRMFNLCTWFQSIHLIQLLPPQKTQVNRSTARERSCCERNPWKAMGTQPKLLRSWTCCASLSTWLHSTSGALYHPPETVALRMQEFERQGVVGKWYKFPRIWWLNIIFPIQYYSVILKLPFWILLGYPLILEKPWQAHIRHIQKHGKTWGRVASFDGGLPQTSQLWPRSLAVFRRFFSRTIEAIPAKSSKYPPIRKTVIFDLWISYLHHLTSILVLYIIYIIKMVHMFDPCKFINSVHSLLLNVWVLGLEEFQAQCKPKTFTWRFPKMVGYPKKRMVYNGKSC